MSHNPQLPQPRFDFSRVRISPETSPVAQTLAETDRGTETLASTTTADGGTTTLATCSSGISGGSFSDIPSGQTLPAALIGDKLTRSFNMVATFTPTDPSCASNCGEYRQYVKGQFTSNGTTVTHPLCGTNLDPTTYQEDCGIFGGKNLKYGYHSNKFATSFFDNPDQDTGLTFHGFDSPGIRGSSGDVLGMQLDFKGELVDTCNGDTVLQTAEWSVAGNATVP